MNDLQLFILLKATMAAGLTRAGVAGVEVKQNFQPIQQGPNTAPTIYLFKIGDRRYGSPRRAYVPNAAPALMDRTETQQMETTFQATALAVMGGPNDFNQLTASDLANTVAAIMQSDEGQAQLWAAGVGILRVTDVRNPPFTNDRKQFEFSPSFDFVLTHKRSLVSVAPAVVTTESGFYRV